MQPEEVYILDSSALLAFFSGGEGKAAVEEILQRSTGNLQVEVYVTTVDWGRTLCHWVRTRGDAAGRKISEEVEKMPVNLVVINKKIAREAATLAVECNLDYLEAFPCAMGVITGGTVVTANREMKKAEEAVELLFLPPFGD